jgi:hypothetical protein
VDWNQNGVYDTAVVLEGDQCLVFFLGGIPIAYTPTSRGALSNLPPQVQGFSTNPKNPADLLSTADRIGPFFEFQTDRLVSLQVSAGLLRSPFNYSYLDRYGTSDGLGNLVSGVPLAYFSSYKQANGYNRYLLLSGVSDCPSLISASGVGVYPYAETILPSGPKYLKPNDFQIISAGADLTFGSGSVPTVTAGVITGFTTGAGTTWTSATAAADYPQNTAPGAPGAGGYDDQANFAQGQLGLGQ